MGRSAIIKKSNETIITKNRRTETFFCNKFKLERAYDYSNVNVRREKVLNELYRESGFLNNYISSISNSIICYNGLPKNGEEVVYFTDTKGRKKEILLPGISQMMREKSYSLVTLEGIVLLYTSEQIVATVDCFTESTVIAEDIAANVKKINFLFIDYIYEKVYVNYTTYNNEVMQKEIKFKVNFTPQRAPSSTIELVFK